MGQLYDGWQFDKDNDETKSMYCGKKIPFYKLNHCLSWNKMASYPGKHNEVADLNETLSQLTNSVIISAPNVKYSQDIKCGTLLDTIRLQRWLASLECFDRLVVCRNGT